MKFKTVTFFLFLLFSTQASFAQSIDDEIVNLINSGDMVSLNHRLQTAKDSISDPTVKLLGEAFVYTSTNKPSEAKEVIEILLQEHQEHLGMQDITVAIELLAENMRNYENSSNMLQGFLDQTAEFNGLDSLTQSNLSNQVRLRVFGNAMQPEIIRPLEDCEIVLSTQILKDQPLYRVDVLANGETHPFVFDTGCAAFGTNVITESVAEKLGVRLLNDLVRIKGIGEDYVRLGVLA